MTQPSRRQLSVPLPLIVSSARVAPQSAQSPSWPRSRVGATGLSLAAWLPQAGTRATKGPGDGPSSDRSGPRCLCVAVCRGCSWPSVTATVASDRPALSAGGGLTRPGPASVQTLVPFDSAPRLRQRVMSPESRRCSLRQSGNETYACYKTLKPFESLVSKLDLGGCTIEAVSP